MAWVVPGRPEPRRLDDEFLGADIAELFRGSGGEGAIRERLWPELDAQDADVYAEVLGLFSRPGPQKLTPSR